MSNAYLDEFLSSTGDWQWDVAGFNKRNRLTQKYAWAIPDDSAIATIAEHSPLIEIGAGNGYWASLLQEAGATVIPYDIDPPKKAERYTDVFKGDESKVAEYRDATLFLCWPPYDEPMAANCLRMFKGRKVIYIGESGGCTGDEDFHKILSEYYTEVTTQSLVQWPYIHDYLMIYERKGR